MRKPPSLSERARYRFDNLMSRGSIALVGALFVTSALVIVLGAVLVAVLGVGPEQDGEKQGLLSLLWISAMRAMDAGAVGGDDGSPLYLLLMLLVTLGGIFIVSALIGVLNNGLGAKVDELRKGKSRVIESGHTLLLGWSGHIHTVVNELCLAAESAGGTTIVIVADKDKIEMDDELATKVPDRRGSRVVVRSGSPIDLDDLDLGSPETARAIVVLGSEGPVDPDASVIKTVLALVAHKPREEGKHHIVAEIRDPKNAIPAKMVGRDEVELVVTSEVIARIAVQTCRQAGLSAIYTDLLDFGGDEIYFHRAASLAGKTFGDALAAFDRSAVIGLHTGGKSQLLPPMDTAIAADDALIVIAADENAIQVDTAATPAPDRTAQSSIESPVPGAERTLILGWNGRGPTIVAELDKYAVMGSELTIVADDDAPREALQGIEDSIVRHTLKIVKGDVADRRLLDSLDVRRFEHIITLSYADKLGVQAADAVTLVTLLHLRDIEEKHGESFSVVSEMLDVKNQKLAEVTKADDFIVSDNLVSLLLAQLAENKALGPVFQDLFDADGAEIYLKAADTYVEPGKSVDFHTVLDAARKRGEIAIGYDLASGGGVTLNPPKRERITFETGDRVVVLAES